MVRQRPRKAIEELYASKFDANPTKSPLTPAHNGSSGNNNSNSNHNSNMGGHGHGHGHGHGGINNPSGKNQRSDRDYGGYIITSNTPYQTTAAPEHKPAVPATGRRKTARQPATKAAAEKLFGKDEKLLNLEDLKKESNARSKTSRNEKVSSIYGGTVNAGALHNHNSHNNHNNHNNHSIHNNHFSHNNHSGHNSNHIGNSSNMNNSSNNASANNHGGFLDNKSFVNYSENLLHKEGHHTYNHHHQQQQQQQQQLQLQQQQQPPHHDDDKDDDTEEFFELIRQTVENAIGKSISDLLNRNFRELSAKVDRFSGELKATNSLLHKLQTEMNNKVVHYGEENSRHFRYLCMKSEYDKMFYQHHTMIAAQPAAASAAPAVPGSTGGGGPGAGTTAATMATMAAAAAAAAAAASATATASGDNSRSSQAAGKSLPSSMTVQSEKSGSAGAGPTTACSCRGSKSPTSEPHKSSSEERSMSQKSSEMGMREVLEHIQRFCTQIQLGDLKGCPSERAPKSGFRHENGLKLGKQDFRPGGGAGDEEEDDEVDVDDDDDDDDDEDDFQLSSDGMTPRSEENLPQKFGGNTMRSCNTTRGGTGGGDA